MSNKPHGIAIVCEHEHGATSAWVDHRISREVPAGYFVEWWPQRRVAYAGTMTRGYSAEYGDTDINHEWYAWYDAIVWCREQDRVQRREDVAA